jgi:hypothetical protein
MRHLASALLLVGVLAACGSAREDFRTAVKAELAKERAAEEAGPDERGTAEVVKAELDKARAPADEGGTAMSLEDGEPEVTDAAGRAYLAKLTSTGDAACACKTEECGKSVMDSWMLGVVAGSSYTLSPADKGREEKQLQRMLLCATTGTPDKRASLARAKAETKAARDKALALIEDTYDGESATTRAAIRRLRGDLRELCACTTMACVEQLQPRFTDPPVVTSKREVEVVTGLLAGVVSCGSYIVTNEALAAID